VENAFQKKVGDSACHYAVTGNYSELKGLGKKNKALRNFERIRRLPEFSP
jgi:hypothetical protein